ncbi:MAG: hypothetical protein QUS14_08715 [Pyrinomonadaceae bacterium]|nr:hypothetical protein [Pyrinomonadaceae bacterium]
MYFNVLFLNRNQPTLSTRRASRVFTKKGGHENGSKNKKQYVRFTAFIDNEDGEQGARRGSKGRDRTRNGCGERRGDRGCGHGRGYGRRCRNEQDRRRNETIGLEEFVEIAVGRRFFEPIIGGKEECGFKGRFGFGKEVVIVVEECFVFTVRIFGIEVRKQEFRRLGKVCEKRRLERTQQKCVFRRNSFGLGHETKRVRRRRFEDRRQDCIEVRGGEELRNSKTEFDCTFVRRLLGLI